jgi:hypothetical protein
VRQNAGIVCKPLRRKDVACGVLGNREHIDGPVVKVENAKNHPSGAKQAAEKLEILGQ